MKAICRISRFLFFLLPVLLRGQEVSYRHYTPDNGLPSSEVYYIHQDKDDFIWVATDRGLCRYNGSSLETFTTKNGPTDHVTFSINEDSKGVLWFNTFSRGLYCYSKDSGFYTPSFNKQLLDHLEKSNWIDQVLFDGPSRVWFSLAQWAKDPAFYCFDEKKGLIKESIPRIEAYKMFLRKTGSSFLIHNSLKHDPALNPDTKVTVTAVAQDNYEISFMDHPVHDALLTGPRQLICAARNELLVIENGLLKKQIHLNGDCLRLYLCGKELWTSTNNGAYLFDAGNLDKVPSCYLPGVTVTSVLRDKEGNHWFSTLDRGIYMAASLDFRIHSALSGNVITLFPVDGKLRGLTYPKTIFEMDSNRVLSYPGFSELKKQHPGIRTPEYATLYSKYSINGSRYPFRGIIPSNTKCISRISNGWVLGLTAGFDIQYDTSEIPWSAGTAFNHRVNAVCQDSSGEIWLGTLLGLYHFRPGDSIVQPYRDVTERINAFAVYRNVLVAGTAGNGLIVISGKKKIYIGEVNGLAGNYISTLYLQDNILWVGTNQGFSRMTLAENGGVSGLQSYSQNDGLLSNEVTCFSYYDHLLWIGTTKGLAYIEPSKLKPKRVRALTTYISSILVNDSPFAARNSLQLGYHQRTITFNYAGISFANPGATRYFYKLEGLHTNWLRTSEKTVKFVNLPPGDYTFHVASFNSISGIPHASASIQIHIDKHFMQTWWAIGSIMILTMIIVWGGFHLYIRSHQKKIALGHKLILAEQQALRAQMNPHFIFNALNSVQYYITENDKRAAGIFLSKFSSLVRSILENSNRSVISLEEELDCIRKYLELEQVRFGHKFSFVMHVDEDIPLRDTRIPSMLLQPFLENAIWHGIMPNDQPGKLLFSVKRVAGNLEFLIEDNGIGRQRAARIIRAPSRHKSSALANIEKRISLLNQLLGLNIDLRVVDLYDNFQKPAGTRIHLVFQDIKPIS